MDNVMLRWSLSNPFALLMQMAWRRCWRRTLAFKRGPWRLKAEGIAPSFHDRYLWVDKTHQRIITVEIQRKANI